MPVDPFEEWLRYHGYWSCADVTSDSDNIRVYVPIPRDSRHALSIGWQWSWKNKRSLAAGRSQTHWP